MNTLHDPAAAGAKGIRPDPFSADIGILVVGHGTADPLGVAETRRVAELVANQVPGVPVALGFLEICGPSIADALRSLRDAGCREAVVAPLLLFEAGHAKRDVPDAIFAAAAVEGIEVRQAAPLGCHSAIIALSKRRRMEAIAAHDDVAAAETTLVIVGRGSSDPAAVSQIKDFSARSIDGEPSPRRLLVGFVAAARPTLDEVLFSASDPAEGGVRRIIVQPHLLFHGHVEKQVIVAIDAVRARMPDIQWIRVARLGPDSLVAEAIVARATEALLEITSPNPPSVVTMPSDGK